MHAQSRRERYRVHPLCRHAPGIHQIAQLFDAVYDTVHTTIGEIEAAFERGFYLVRQRIQHAIDGPTQIDEPAQKYSGYKEQTPTRKGGVTRSIVDYRRAPNAATNLSMVTSSFHDPPPLLRNSTTSSPSSLNTHLTKLLFLMTSLQSSTASKT